MDGCVAESARVQSEGVRASGAFAKVPEFGLIELTFMAVAHLLQLLGRLRRTAKSHSPECLVWAQTLKWPEYSLILIINSYSGKELPCALLDATFRTPSTMENLLDFQFSY